MKSFSLHPFESDSDLKLSGSITRTENRLQIRYDVLDDHSRLLIPAAHVPTRQDNLWKTTCFEFFLGIQNSPQYWEFNLSPSGDWNVYYFEKYRAEMKVEKAFTALPFKVNVREKRVSLSIKLDLNAIAQPNQKFDVAVTAVIETSDHNVSYWAVQHCGNQADFHLRESFALKV